jgi:hypothetical protein
MLRHYEESIQSNFEGTIIDIETIGQFNKRYSNTNDSRLYQHIKQIIFGYINSSHIYIICAESRESIQELNLKSLECINKLERPFYAFNSNFEQGVWFHQLGIKISINGELNAERYESKKRAVMSLSIPQYGDPFHDDGLKCMYAWLEKQYDNAIAHNRACLLKERDILLKRGFRKPDVLLFNEA